MCRINDLDLNWDNWKKRTDIVTDSLWIFSGRDKSWKHSNFYHGNFIPQIVYQVLMRYTKKWDFVLDFFIWSWTTAIECERLRRNVIWVDIRCDLIERLNNLINWDIQTKFICSDSTRKEIVDEVKHFLSNSWKDYVDLVILHPPYFDIIKFSDKKEDLSNSKSLEEFLERFKKVVENSNVLLKKWWFLIIVIGDIYKKWEWIPLGFYCLQKAQEVGFKLKSIVVKNIEWNRWKLWIWWIWRYRALKGGFYVFKHEYILVFRK